MRSKCLLFLNRRRRRKRNTKTESPVAIVSLTASTSRQKRFINFVAGRIFYSRVFLVIWKLTNLFCDSWHATQDPKHIANLQGNPCKSKAGESQGRAPGQANDYKLRPATLLTVAPMTRRFTKISGSLTSPGPRYFVPLPPPPLSSALCKNCTLVFINLHPQIFPRG